MDDLKVIAAAAREGRIVITHDRSTMPVHFGNFVATQTSPGLFILSQELPLAAAVEELLMIWEASETEEWMNTIQFRPL